MMHSSIFIQPEVAAAIIDLVVELATELDLHYEDDELVAAAPSIEKMDHMVAMLIAAGYAPPPAYTHIVDRYHRALN